MSRLSLPYLKRPYSLPRVAEAVAVPRYLDKAGNELPAYARGEDIAEAVYDINLNARPLCAHPAFTLDANGKHRTLTQRG